MDNSPLQSFSLRTLLTRYGIALIVVGVGLAPTLMGRSLIARAFSKSQFPSGLGGIEQEAAAHPDVNAVASRPSDYVVAARWEKSPVTYSFANCPRSLDCAQAHEAVRQAIEAWDAVSGITLNEVASNGDINVSWETGEHGDLVPFDGPGGKVAHASFPYTNGDFWLDGDVHFDDDETWVVSGFPAKFPQEVHLPSVALHEVGHALGLDHNNDPASLMWPVYTGVRQMSADDIAGIQSIYGPANAEDAAPAITTSSASGVVTGTTAAPANLRSGPSTSAAVIGQVQPGIAFSVLGRNADASWLYVDSQGTRGWIAAWLSTVNGSAGSLPITQ